LSSLCIVVFLLLVDERYLYCWHNGTNNGGGTNVGKYRKVSRFVAIGIIGMLYFNGIRFLTMSEPDPIIVGYIDRFEDDHAVILIEKFKEEITLPKKILPTNSKENTHLQIKLVPKPNSACHHPNYVEN